MAEKRSGPEQLGHRLPAQTPGSAHFHNDFETRLPSAEIAQRQQFGAGQNLAFQQPEHDRLIAKKNLTELGHHFLNLANGSTTTNALVAQMGRAHPMFLKQKHLRISKPAGGT